MPPSAITLPGAADAGRVRSDESPIELDHSQDEQTRIPDIAPTVAAPEAAKGIHFVLQTVNIEGATAFTPQQLADIYQPYIGKEVTLDIAWMIAGSITERYRNARYFLSRAYVPQQSIKDGAITINVIEGTIGVVELPDALKGNRIVQAYANRLLAQKPSTTDEVESVLLRLNDLPGYAFRAVLSPIENAGKNETAVKLTLLTTPREHKGSIGMDNFSSRYLGPGEISASYSDSLIPLEQTSISGFTSLPVQKLHYGTIDQLIPVAPDIALEFNGSLTRAHPGYTLSPYDISSQAVSESVSINYQWLRQREESLALKLMYDSRNVISDLLQAPLTRDYIRAIRAGATYDRSDGWLGYNIGSLTLSHGIDGLGSNKKGDADISREGAVPNFSKLELSLTRLQGITENWSLLAAASGQWASGPLYSSEQFGYGGQQFGRAYDASDITGDHGLSASLELRYDGFGKWQDLGLQPYSFYDIGTVWNESIGQPKRESGASAGFGVRFNTPWHQSGMAGLAWPLTRDITTPIYNDNEKRSPRLLLQIVQQF